MDLRGLRVGVGVAGDKGFLIVSDAVRLSWCVACGVGFFSGTCVPKGIESGVPQWDHI